MNDETSVFMRRGLFRISAEMFIRLLERLAEGQLVLPDGKIITIEGMPTGCRVIGVRVEHWGAHVIELLLEGDEMPWWLEGQAVMTFRPIFHERTANEATEDGVGASAEPAPAGAR